MPVTGTGLRLIEEVNALLKYQLVGFVQGVSKLWSGRLARPGGFRGVDFVLQDYEGTVTIRPAWGLRELSKFLANFDEFRVDKYMRDGQRATWPQIELIRSLCEIEFCLDEVAADLSRTMAAARAAHHLTNGGANGDPERGRTESFGGLGGLTRGKLPSYVSLAAYGEDGVPSPSWPAGMPDRPVRIRSEPSGHGVSPAYPISPGTASARVSLATKAPGVASSASMMNLASLDGEAAEDPPESIGMASFNSS